jgi:hypothetical protein
VVRGQFRRSRWCAGKWRGVAVCIRPELLRDKSATCDVNDNVVMIAACGATGVRQLASLALAGCQHAETTWQVVFLQFIRRNSSHRFRNTHPAGRAKHDEEASDPNGIRTRVTAVKGRCPGPLDDRVKKRGNIESTCLGARQIAGEISTTAKLSAPRFQCVDQSCGARGCAFMFA